MEPIDISIITYNSSEWIDGFFQSLSKQSYPLDLISVHVTDNGSCDSSIALLQAWKNRLAVANFLIHESSNNGFGAAHNNNFKYCSNRFVLVANIDLQFSMDSIDILLNFAIGDDQSAAQWEMRQKPHEHPKIYDPISLEVTWCSSACALFRRDAFLEVGGYDDVFFMYGEDVDLSWRLRAAGYRLRYVPSATCWHFTYSESKFKRIQFLGSLLGNLYIRARFGNSDDVAKGETNYLAVIENAQENYPGQKEDLKNNFEIYLSNKDHFLNTHIDRTTNFKPKFFGDWDYEQTRDGAFWELRELPDQQPLVSIIVRTYKGRDFFLRNCIQSLINQTYRNFEVIVVEDGGSSTKTIVDEFQDARLRHLEHPKAGRCHTGNFGLQESKGTWLGFLDDDDLFFADHIEVLVSALLENKNNKAAYANAFEVKTEITRNDDLSIASIEEQKPFLLFDLDFKHTELLIRNLMPIQSVLFHRSLYEQAGGFSVELDNLEDWNLWTKYAALTSFSYVKKTTSIFRTPANPIDFQKRNHDMHQYYAAATEQQRNIFLSGVSAATLRSEIEQYKSEENRLNNDIVNLRNHLDMVAKHFRETESQHMEIIQELRSEYNKLQTAHDAILTSTSWRATRIIRATGSLLKYFASISKNYIR